MASSLSPASRAPGGPGAFEPEDRRRLARAVDRAREALARPPEALLPAALRGGRAGRVLVGRCGFAHHALLLFPSTARAALAAFAEAGLDPARPVPSVVVKERLAARYGLEPGRCEVWVTRLLLTGPDAARGRPAVEAFLFPRSCAALDARIVREERRRGLEDHTAFSVAGPDERMLEALLDALDGSALCWEGGGYNPHEGPYGSTVLYFVGTEGGTEGGALRRWELSCPGDFRAVTERHPVDAGAVARAYAASARPR
ncbi:hypothetical protein GCM10009801_67980 [Streptomyces albiaxialis]|uniref:Uncharacterized protein n=1 Tax=Streptomyces albiaxialis TaxID=329523 RepID=A0ABN2WRR8_9ACTN